MCKEKLALVNSEIKKESERSSAKFLRKQKNMERKIPESHENSTIISIVWEKVLNFESGKKF